MMATSTAVGGEHPRHPQHRAMLAHLHTSNERSGSSETHKQQQHPQQQPQPHQPTPSTITTFASPTSSASSSICSSPSSCSSCSECDDGQAPASLLQVSDGGRPHGSRQPRASTNASRSACRHRVHQHHHHHHHRAHSSLSNSGTVAHHQHAHADQPLFSPITSNGSVVSSESCSKSRPGSPLRSSVGSVLPPAENSVQQHLPAATRAVVQQPEIASLTDAADRAEADASHNPQDSVHSTSASAGMDIDPAPAAAGDTAPLQQEELQRPASNPRKSARRHSENGMKTPDEALYSSSSTHLPVSSTPSIPSPSSRQNEASDGAFVAPSMYARTASLPAGPIQYHHPGTPAVTGSNISVQRAPVPLMIRNPGERRIQNEETRPARRKVHRIDTSSHSSSSSASTTPSVVPAQGRAHSTSGLSRKASDRMPVERTTFLHQQRPSPHSDSYFPPSSSQNSRIQSRSSSRSNLVINTSKSSTPASPLKSVAVAGKKDVTASMASSDQQHRQPEPLHHAQQAPDAKQILPPKESEQNKHDKKQRQLEELRDKERNMEHIDIANYPTLTLLQLLAALLTKITAKNDAIRDGVDDPHPSSSESHPSAHVDAGGNATAGEERNGDASQDEYMERDDDAQPGQDLPSTASGTFTPPSQIYSHSRDTSNEPVTPAVPFSSPALSRNPSSMSRDRYSAAGNGNEGRGNKDEEDVFEHDSRLTVSSAIEKESTVRDDDVSKEARKRGRSKSMEEEDSALQPRHNFYRPPTAPTSSKPTGLNLASADHPAASNSRLSSTAHTILTSAANALAMPNATLCFHARNIPSISIEAYLVRISKYCPTTNEVFISLLVYFDRMSRLPNLSNLTASLPSSSNTTQPISNTTNAVSLKPDGGSSNNSGNMSGTAHTSPSQTLHTRPRSTSNPPESSTHSPQHSQHSTFAVDSYNIHRLTIAGVTVASKFFSDVFYTNSRYAKVGGLPLTELNALELQFLLLNGFDLVVSPEELQRYADYLLIGVLPPLATDTPDRFGSRSSSSLNFGPAGLGRYTTTPADTPPASRAHSPSKTPVRMASAATSHGLFGLTLRRNMAQQEQQATGVPSASSSMNAHPPSSAENNAEAPHTLRSTIMDSSTRPKTSSRSTSESSTSASEASTVVPSESSVDTERGEVDHSTADEDTGVEDDDGMEGDSRMTDVSGAPSPAVASQSRSFSHHQNTSPRLPQQAQQAQQKESLPINATLGADIDGFAIPARPRPPLSRTSSGGNGQRHPLLATSSGSRTPSNGGSSRSHSSGGKTSAATGTGQGINSTSVKGSAGKASTNKGNVSMHRRENSRTREWTMQQQQQRHLHGTPTADEDAEMADQE